MFAGVDGLDGVGVPGGTSGDRPPTPFICAFRTSSSLLSFLIFLSFLDTAEVLYHCLLSAESR